jgi:hypothetical protein
MRDTAAIQAPSVQKRGDQNADATLTAEGASTADSADEGIREFVVEPGYRVIVEILDRLRDGFFGHFPIVISRP